MAAAPHSNSISFSWLVGVLLGLLGAVGALALNAQVDHEKAQTARIERNTDSLVTQGRVLDRVDFRIKMVEAKTDTLNAKMDRLLRLQGVR